MFDSAILKPTTKALADSADAQADLIPLTFCIYGITLFSERDLKTEKHSLLKVPLPNIIYFFNTLNFFDLCMCNLQFMHAWMQVKFIFEPHHEKTGFMHMRKQRRRSASR